MDERTAFRVGGANASFLIPDRMTFVFPSGAGVAGRQTDGCFWEVPRLYAQLLWVESGGSAPADPKSASSAEPNKLGASSRPKADMERLSAELCFVLPNQDLTAMAAISNKVATH